MPDFLFHNFRPKVIGEITKEDEVIGKVVGINIKPFNPSDSKQYESYIEAILKVKSEMDTKIYIEGAKDFPLEFFKAVEESTGLIFSSGDNIRILNIPLLIKEIYKCLSKDSNSADTLIICDNKEMLIEIITILSESINFFTIIGLAPSQMDELYDEVFESTGVSIFQPNSIEKIIKNYGTIINVNDKINFEMKEIRNQSVIIDFSRKKPFKYLENSKKNIIYIEDVNFKVNSFNSWIETYVQPELFESLGGEKDRFSHIYTKNDYYLVEDYIKSEIKMKGRI